MRKIKTFLSLILALFVLLYLAAVLFHSLKSEPEIATLSKRAEPLTIAIFGASGTAGDGVLKASLASSDIDKIHVFTRRSTERIEAGVAVGKVVKTEHMDYLDYSDILEKLSEVDAVYWAIGISAIGADEETYGRIHTDFPAALIKSWNSVALKTERSFQFISSSDISEESDTMWVRQKIRAEKTLFGLAENSDLRVIAYRPDYIGSTQEQAHIGQKILYCLFRPVGVAVKAREIGEAMLAVSLMLDNFENGSKISTANIIQYSKAYRHYHLLD